MAMHNRVDGASIHKGLSEGVTDERWQKKQTSSIDVQKKFIQTRPVGNFICIYLNLFELC